MPEPKYFIYCPTCTSPLKPEATRAAQQYCTNCHWKYYFPTPQTAAAVVLNDERKVLLIRRTNEPFKGEWSLPAGFVSYGELPIQAALRELHEETGLFAEYEETLGQYIADDHPDTFSLLTIILTKNPEGIPTPQDDAEDLQYFPLNNLPVLAFKAHSIALKNLL